MHEPDRDDWAEYEHAAATLTGEEADDVARMDLAVDLIATPAADRLPLPLADEVLRAWRQHIDATPLPTIRQPASRTA